MNREEIYKEIEEIRERILEKVRERETMQHFVTLSDIGGVRVASCDFEAVYPNGYGDGQTDVIICEDDEAEQFEEVEFITSFNVVRSGSVYLMRTDCGEFEKTLHTFLPGRYFVWSNKGLGRQHGLVIFSRQVERVTTDNRGSDTDYNDAVERMDDEVREQVHADFAPCSHQEFFNRYCVRHFEKFGEDFVEQLDVRTWDD
jgi:hypothetical protein